MQRFRDEGIDGVRLLKLSSAAAKRLGLTAWHCKFLFKSLEGCHERSPSPSWPLESANESTSDGHLREQLAVTFSPPKKRLVLAPASDTDSSLCQFGQSLLQDEPNADALNPKQLASDLAAAPAFRSYNPLSV